MANKDAQKEIYISGDIAEPNVVDDYSSYTYNITFSMLPQSFHYSAVLPIGNQSKGKVIIAQTGVTTKFNIDNLTINTVTDNYGSHFTSTLGYTTKATFEITEPLGSSLVTLMSQGFKELKKMDAANGNDSQQLYNKKKSMGPLDLMYLLEVDLIGHRGYQGTGGGNDGGDLLTPLESSSIVENAEGGEIFGKYAWPVYLTQFNFNPDHEGTKYLFEVVSVQNYIKKLPANTRKIKEDFEILDTTLQGFFNQLSEKINKNIVSEQSALNKSSGEKRGAKHNHSIAINLGTMHGKLADDTGDITPDNWIEKVNPVDFGAHRVHPVTEKKSPSEEAGADTEGAEEVTIQKAKLSFKKGQTIKSAIEKICRLNSNFCTLTTDFKFKTNDYEFKERKDPKVDSMYSINHHKTTVAKKGVTSSTGGPAFLITYTVDLKLQAGAISETPKEETIETQKKIIKKWGIIKKYDYMFSGLNDQVMDVDLSFNPGQIFLFPEHGGITPTYRDAASKIANKTSAEQSQEKQSERLNLTTDADIILEHFKQLQTELKGAISQITEDGKDFLLGIKAQTELAKNPAGAIKNLNGRLPSSPASVFHKVTAIQATTDFFDGLYTDIVDFQTKITESVESFSQNLLPELAKLVTDSVQPFEFVSTFKTGLNGKLQEFSTGLDGFAEGLGFDAGLIPGMDEVRNVVGKLEDLTSQLPDKFEPGTIGGGSFELLSQHTEDNENTYLEELDFKESFAEEDTQETDVSSETKGEAKPQSEDSEDIIPAQHYMSTLLSYSDTGIPYLARLNMEIKGDPYWIGSENHVKNMSSTDPITLMNPDGSQKRWKPEFSTDRADRSTAPYDAGSLFFAFRYLFPKEYAHYHDDPANHTGIMTFGGMDLSYSGYYMVVKVTHSFVQGQFKQEMDAVKMTTYPNKVIFADGSELQDQEDAAENETESAGIGKNNANSSGDGSDVGSNNPNTGISEEQKEVFANEDIYRGDTDEGRIDYIKDKGYLPGDPPPTNYTDTFTTSADYTGGVDPIPMDNGVSTEWEIDISKPRLDYGGGG